MVTTQPTGPESSSSTGFNRGFLATAIVYPTLSLEQQTEVLMNNGSAIIDNAHIPWSTAAPGNSPTSVGGNIDGTRMPLLS